MNGSGGEVQVSEVTEVFDGVSEIFWLSHTLEANEKKFGEYKEAPKNIFRWFGWGMKRKEDCFSEMKDDAINFLIL